MFKSFGTALSITTTDRPTRDADSTADGGESNATSFVAFVSWTAAFEILLVRHVMETGDRNIVLMAAGLFVIAAYLFELAVRTYGTVALVSAAALYCIGMFPITGNHVWLYLWIAVLWVAFGGAHKLDEKNFVEGVKMICAFMFFWSGLKKMVYGAYDRGEFFAHAFGGWVTFHRFLLRMLPRQ